ncbi:hypothetical protein BAE44_0024825 [Dichanthelium oligosanthes]|uniref:Uncharacterized protein n=1 Tax=Dichanthelium oligosanthes TaxID=888268 RepID=A0A1E5UMR9_9POAL|nr:hypothetical protein BAE44_0024825 [Dichanthelium oligosanthes]
MADLKPSSDAHLDPAAPPATPRKRRLSWLTVAILLGLAVNLALCVRRVGDDRRAVAFVGFSHINLLLLFGAIRRFELSPHGSPARGRARLAVWLLTTTLTAAFTWKIGAMLPLSLAIAVWIMAAATVLGGFYMLFLHGEK